MKANEAPENIYILPDDRNSTNLSICWYEAPYSTGAIEYTRTDAFIEKACDFISSLRRLDDDVIDEFRKYMEGE